MSYHIHFFMMKHPVYYDLMNCPRITLNSPLRSSAINQFNTFKNDLFRYWEEMKQYAPKLPSAAQVITSPETTINV